MLRARVIASGARGLGIPEAVARTGWRAQQIISGIGRPIRRLSALVTFLSPPWPWNLFAKI